MLLTRLAALRVVEGRRGLLEGSVAKLHDVGRGLIAPETAPAPGPALHHERRRKPIRALLRNLARRVIAATPVAIRGDVRLVLIHGLEIVRKMLRSVAPAVLVAAPDTAAPDAYDEIMKIRQAMCDRSIEIGWPKAGEVLWICGHYGAFVPLRLIAEARGRLGFSCAVICYDLIRNENPEWNPELPRGLFYDCLAVDLLDVADRILCISAHTRSCLLSFAPKYGRDVSDARVVTLGCDLPLVAPARGLASGTYPPAFRALRWIR